MISLGIPVLLYRAEMAAVFSTVDLAASVSISVFGSHQLDSEHFVCCTVVIYHRRFLTHGANAPCDKVRQICC